MKIMEQAGFIVQGKFKFNLRASEVGRVDELPGDKFDWGYWDANGDK